MSREEALERFADKVARQGFAIQVVEGDHRHRGWAYTVGLVEHYGHPEFVLAEAKVAAAAAVLDELGESVRGGRAYVAGDTAPAAGLRVELSPVHPAHLRHGIFNSWLELYSWLPSPPEFRALEVVLPPEAFCACHQNQGPYLATASSPLVRPLANRAARRANQRRRGG